MYIKKDCLDFWKLVMKFVKMLKEEVEADDIAEVVSKWTGVPVTRMLEAEMEKYFFGEGSAAPKEFVPPAP